MRRVLSRRSTDTSCNELLLAMWRQVSGLAQSRKNTFMLLYATFLYAPHLLKYHHCSDSLQVIAESIAPYTASDAIQPMDGHQSPAPLGVDSTDGSPAVLYCSTTYAACLPAAAQQHRCCRCAFSATTPSLLFGPTQSHPFYFYFICIHFVLAMSQDNSNPNPIPCSVALSTSRYGTTTSPDRHVLGYHITPDNEPITNSSLN